MARIRTIKPEFFTSEQIAECSTNARLMFVGMWCFCDDQGIHPASYKSLKMQIFPGDDLTINQIKSYIEQLLANNLLIEYVVDNKTYWQVTGWNHQKIDRPNPKYTPPNNSTIIRRSFDDQSPPEGKGRESKGRDSIIPPIPPPDEKFEKFWDVFPKKRKGNKSKAQSAWNSALTRATGETIYESAKNYESSDEVARGFAKGAAAWLNDDRWTVQYSATGSDRDSSGSGNDTGYHIADGGRSNQQQLSKWEIAGARVIAKIERGEI